MEQRQWSAVHWIVPPGLLNLPSFRAQNHLPSVGITYCGMHPLAFIWDEENVLQVV